MSPARLARYMPAAKGDKHLALRLYIWNGRICEALYLPMQFAEVSSRNAIQLPVGKRFGEDWFENDKFRNLLAEKMRGELDETVRKERKRRKHYFTQNHIIAGLSFGFWIRLMTKAYDNQLWANGVVNSFPNAGKDEDREAIYQRLDRLRRFRNDIAHHVAIFDRKPQSELQNAMHITNSICSDTHWLAASLSNVSRVINERPS